MQTWLAKQHGECDALLGVVRVVRWQQPAGRLLLGVVLGLLLLVALLVLLGQLLVLGLVLVGQGLPGNAQLLGHVGHAKAGVLGLDLWVVWWGGLWGEGE
jgi:hypothetical protein